MGKVYSVTTGRIQLFPKTRCQAPGPSVSQRQALQFLTCVASEKEVMVDMFNQRMDERAVPIKNSQ